jgi:hypothetical protein
MSRWIWVPCLSGREGWERAWAEERASRGPPQQRAAAGSALSPNNHAHTRSRAGMPSGPSSPPPSPCLPPHLWDEQAVDGSVLLCPSTPSRPPSHPSPHLGDEEAVDGDVLLSKARVDPTGVAQPQGLVEHGLGGWGAGGWGGVEWGGWGGGVAVQGRGGQGGQGSPMQGSRTAGPGDNPPDPCQGRQRRRSGPAASLLRAPPSPPPPPGAPP